MSGFEITPHWPDSPEHDPDDSAEDKATLCELVVSVDAEVLTTVDDGDSKRNGPRVSACAFAEWLVWNWWRQRFEPMSDSANPSLDWLRSHETASIGGGWLWPRMTLDPDGVNIGLHTKSSNLTETEPLRHVGQKERFIPPSAFEAGVDSFVASVIGRLEASGLDDTNLSRMWRELSVERGDAELARYRSIEATMGFDVDDANPELIGQVIKDGELMGVNAMREVAADATIRPVQRTAQTLRDLANHRAGLDFNPRDGVQMEPPVGAFGSAPPWYVGSQAAIALRELESLGSGSISDARLADMCGLGGKPFSWRRYSPSPIAFTVSGKRQQRMVLRAKVRNGRRFDAARLLADRLMASEEERLRPATQTRTFRQKMQRAFAAELLCPFNSLVDSLNDDYSDDSLEAAGKRFGVSSLLVKRQLENRGVMPRPWDWTIGRVFGSTLSAARNAPLQPSTTEAPGSPAEMPG